MLKRIVLLGLMVTLGAALAAPLFAANGVQGAAGQVSAADGAALGSAGARIWSSTFATINANTPSCANVRCARPYNTAAAALQGGYISQGEGTAAYNNDADLQKFYLLIDAEANGAACNHAAFYSVQGLLGHVASGTGDFRSQLCPGSAAVNCFERADTRFARPTPVANVNSGYSSAHTNASLGGLSPVPSVRAAMGGSNGCPAGQAKLTWENPESYAGAMKEGVASPVKGVRLYSNASPCSSCPGSSSGWTAGAAFDAAAGTAGTCVPVSGDTWFALTVRLAGPNSDVTGTSEVETGMVGGAGFVGSNSQCVNTSATVTRIVSMSARYAGRGAVNVNFTTGAEGGVQHYFVTRGSAANGPFTRVSAPVVPTGDGSTYTVTDKARTGLGRTAYYAVEIVNADGTTERSGATAVTLPGAKKKLGS